MNSLQRRLIAIISLIAVSIILFAAIFTYYWVSQPTQIDVSWISTVTQMLEDQKPYPIVNGSDPKLSLSYCRIRLFDNGTVTLVRVGNLGTLGSYLESLLSQANIKKQATADLNSVLISGKVVWIQYRTTVIPISQQYTESYFILEDKTNQGLTGTFMVNIKGSLHLWAIQK